MENQQENNKIDFTEDFPLTPRTQEALRRTGIRPLNLKPKPFREFRVNGDSVEFQRLRFNHYETKRKEKICRVLAERAAVMREQSPLTSSVNASQGLQNLQMVESLIAKEAAKLEKELKIQSRQHMSVERENREQLERESQLKQKERYRRERVAAAQKQIEARGQHVKELLDARMEDNRNRLQSLEVELATRRADASAQELLEDQRLREWQMGQSLVISEKSQEEEKKRAALNGKIAEIEMVRALQGQLIRERFDEKISTAERRKETDLAQQILKQKTAHLKLMDARERKEELERVDRHRRDLLGREIEDKEAKISTMLFTKDLLMAQRKILIQQQECLNGKPVNIRQIMPGPAHYSRSMNSVMENPAPKISTSNSKLLIPGSTEFELKKAKSIPPPGSYDPKVLPSGSGLWDEGKISMSKSPKTTYLDEERAIRALAPGPGTYGDASKTSALQRDRGPRFARGYVKTGREPSFLPPPEDSPGPAGYSVDRFYRQERLRRAQKSLPLLARALRLPQ